LIDATSLGIVLYAYRSPALATLHPSGIPLDVLDRLADLSNVVAVKLTQTLDAATALACTRRLSDRILVGSADLSMLATLAQHAPIQWTGQWLTESVQSPQQRNAAEIIASLTAGRIDEAIACYWRIAPAYQTFAALQRPYLLRGAHPWNHMKYYQWCVGGNGGLLRPSDDVEPAPDDDARATIRAAYRSAGITLSDSDDTTFARGRAHAEETI
jgi:4-hydroxy-tetrahydrodipicolinate synthase